MIRTLTFTSSTKLKNWGFHALFLKTTVDKWAGGCIPTWSGCILQLSLLLCNVLVDVPRPIPLVGSQLFARGVNLNWPVGAQSGTCSSRVSNSRRRRTWSTHGRAAVWSSFLRQKIVLWSFWRFCMTGNLPGFMEIWFLSWFVAPHRDERAFCEVGTLRTIVKMERSDRPSTSF